MGRISRLNTTLFFSPLEIQNMKLWLKADAITGLADGDLVETWVDSSPNSRTVNQTTEALRPIYKTNAINGLPVVRFDGTRWMTSNLPNGAGFYPSVTIFLLFRTAVDGTNMDIIGSHSSFSLFVRKADTNKMNAGKVNQVGLLSSNGTVMANQVKCVTLNLKSDATRLGIFKIDRVLDNSVVTGNYPAGSGNLQVGTEASGDYLLTGDIGEIIIYTTILTTDEMLNVETYLMNKWGIL